MPDSWSNTVLGIVLFFMVFMLFATRRLRLKRSWVQGCTAFQKGDLAKAERSFRKCLRVAPESAVVRRMLATLLTRRDEREEAEQHYRMAADLEPRNPEGHLHLGLFLASSGAGRTDDAVDALAKAIELAPHIKDLLRSEPRFASLQGNARFEALLAGGMEQADKPQ
jgi:tetratricopeptide (TPR) repeat protein